MVGPILPISMKRRDVMTVFISAVLQALSVCAGPEEKLSIAGTMRSAWSAKKVTEVATMLGSMTPTAGIVAFLPVCTRFFKSLAMTKTRLMNVR